MHIKMHGIKDCRAVRWSVWFNEQELSFILEIPIQLMLKSTNFVEYVLLKNR